MDEPQLDQAVHRARCARRLPACHRSPGTVGAGDAVTVVGRPAHGVTIGDVFVVRRTEAARLQRLLDEQPDVARTSPTRSDATWPPAPADQLAAPFRSR